MRLRLGVISLFFTSLVLVFAPEDMLARGTSSRAKDAFPHGFHVPSAWLDLNQAEVKRDCQGCHDYYSQATPKDPELQCYSCHHESADGSKKPLTYTGTVAEKRATDSPFKHYDHRAVDCRGCHLPEGGSSQVPDEFPIPSGLGWCVKCHDDNYALKGNDTRTLSAGKQSARNGKPENVQQGLNQSPHMQPRENVVFSHLDHMTVDRVNDPAECDKCHQAMEKSDANFGEKIVDVQGCKACHITQDGKQTPDNFFQVEKARPKPSLSDGTFFHRDHMSIEALAHGDFSGKKCLACHVLQSEAEAAGSIRSYDFETRFSGFKKYDACMECHYHGKEKAELFSVPDHDQVGSFTCYKCHAFAQGPMATNRPMAVTKRHRPVKYEIKVQAHPHITTAAGPDGQIQDCRKCHRTETTTVPSRLKSNRFDHRPHLSREPTTAECQACHTIDAGGMMQMDASGKTVTFNAEKCNDCHRDQNKVMAVEMVEESATVALFPHDLHVGKKGVDGKSMDCASCHELGREPISGSGLPRDFAFKQGVKDCRACHDHGQYTEFTGKKDREYVTKCGSCHKSSTDPKECDIPKPGTSIPIARSYISGVNFGQFHPLPTQQSCSECHTITPSGFRPQPFLALDIKNTRTDGMKFHQEFGNDPISCFYCHWDRINDRQMYVRSPEVPAGDEAAARRVMGNQMLNFPGGPR